MCLSGKEMAFWINSYLDSKNSKLIIDSLGLINKNLNNIIVLKDNEIKSCDTFVKSKNELVKELNEYNSKLENELSKVKKMRAFWKETTIYLAVGITTTIIYNQVRWKEN